MALFSVHDISNSQDADQPLNHTDLSVDIRAAGNITEVDC